jgi:hypothetical protein
MRPVTILISEPCPASWAAMTPAAGGRHCAACAKTVVDFSQKTDAELLVYLAQASRASTCGRLRPDQVGRALVAGTVAPLPGRWRAGLGALLAAISLALPATARAARAGQPLVLAAPGPGSVPVPVAAPQPAAEVQPPAGNYRAEGVVLDAQTHKPLAGATVLLQGTRSGVGTDEHGKFVLPISSAQAKVTLLISFIGYETVKKELDLRATAEPFIIQLQESHYVLGGLGYVSPPQPFWQRAAQFFA